MQKVVSNGVPCVNVWEAPDRVLHFLGQLSDTTDLTASVVTAPALPD